MCVCVGGGGGGGLQVKLPPKDPNFPLAPTRLLFFECQIIISIQLKLIAEVFVTI